MNYLIGLIENDPVPFIRCVLQPIVLASVRLYESGNNVLVSSN